MGRLLQGWRRLTWHERARIAGLSLLLVPIHALLTLIGYARTRSWVERLSVVPTPRDPLPDDMRDACRLAELASIAGRHGLVDASCLRQSLLVYFLLRRKGFGPALTLGVRRQSTILDAHAWVELGGVALGQHELAHVALTGDATPRRAT